MRPCQHAHACVAQSGACTAGHVEEFLKVTMCAPVVQGYGLTETCAGSFISVPDLHVGVPSPALHPWNALPA